jgi:Na+/phosphate symporter
MIYGIYVVGGCLYVPIFLWQSIFKYTVFLINIFLYKTIVLKWQVTFWLKNVMILCATLYMDALDTLISPCCTELCHTLSTNCSCLFVVYFAIYLLDFHQQFLVHNKMLTNFTHSTTNFVLLSYFTSQHVSIQDGSSSGDSILQNYKNTLNLVY